MSLRSFGELMPSSGVPSDQLRLRGGEGASRSLPVHCPVTGRQHTPPKLTQSHPWPTGLQVASRGPGRPQGEPSPKARGCCRPSDLPWVKAPPCPHYWGEWGAGGGAGWEGAAPRPPRTPTVPTPLPPSAPAGPRPIAGTRPQLEPITRPAPLGTSRLITDPP